MRKMFLMSAIFVGIAAAPYGAAHSAETASLAVKAGETLDLDPVFWQANCRSLLKGKPTAEVLEGPPDVVVSIREQKVVPRGRDCAKPIAGGILTVTAPKDVAKRMEGKLTVRVKYPTIDGDRQSTKLFDMVLIPSQVKQ